MNDTPVKKIRRGATVLPDCLKNHKSYVHSLLKLWLESQLGCWSLGLIGWMILNVRLRLRIIKNEDLNLKKIIKFSESKWIRNRLDWDAYLITLSGIPKWVIFPGYCQLGWTVHIYFNFKSSCVVILIAGEHSSDESHGPSNWKTLTTIWILIDLR